MKDINNFLTFFIDAASPENNYILWLKDNEEILEITAQKLQEIRCPILCHDTWRLIDHCIETDNPPPDFIIDINHHKKFVTGLSKSEVGKSSPWDTYQIIKDFFPEKENLKKIRDIFWQREKIPEKNQAKLLLREMLISMQKYYRECMVGDNKTYINFFNIEAHIGNIFFKRQLKGIRVDQNKSNEYLNQIELEYYKSLSKLREDRGFSGGPFDQIYISDLIESRCGYTRDQINFLGIDRALEFSASTDDYLAEIKKIRRLALSKDTLLRACHTRNGKIHPIFDSMGTVTGRILVVEPLLQQLKKSYRSIIVPDAERQLVYIDYSQFEPRIMASLSRDKNLSSSVLNGDIYLDIDQNFFDGKLGRKRSKQLFLQYSYGSTIESMTKYISSLINIPSSEASTKIKNLIDSFSSLEEWKNQVITQSKNEGKIYAGHGLPRIFKDKAFLRSRSKRQAVNHLIQGSGSHLIKLLIIKINEKLPMCDILLPMHDALLISVPQKNSEKYKSILKSMAENQFFKLFDPITAEVTFNDF